MEAVVTHAPLRNWIVGIATVVPAAWLGGLPRSKSAAKPHAVGQPGEGVRA